MVAFCQISTREEIVSMDLNDETIASLRTSMSPGRYKQDKL